MCATGNILPTTGLVFSGAVSCTGGAGTGTSGDPYIGATSCLLPFGTSITTKPFSHYTVQAADFNLPNHQLTDTATVNWNDTCNSGSPNCTTDPQENTAGSSALVQQLALGDGDGYPQRRASGRDGCGGGVDGA